MHSKKYLTTEELKARDDVARQIKALKAEKGFTILDLAEKSDISNSYLCELFREDGDTVPSFQTMIRVFNALGLKEVTIRWG